MDGHEDALAPTENRKKKKGKRKLEKHDDAHTSEVPKKRKRTKRETVNATPDQNIEEASTSENRKRKKKAGKQSQDKTKSPRKKNKNLRKKKEELKARRQHLCLTTQKYVGAHVSITGGIWKAALRAKHIGARAFGLFLRSQRTWNNKALEESAAEKFKRTCEKLGFESSFIVPHSPYIMNLGSPKPDVLQKSRAILVDGLNRCNQLGLTLYNIHPGSHVGEVPVKKCVALIADSINYAHSQVPGVTVVLENMCCQGSTVGGRFEELHGIIERIKDKTRIGVCLDTCHAFAAGYNLSEENGLAYMLDEFDEIVGLSYLRAVHLNDSKGKVGCRLDRHENIGQGHIGINGFRQVMNEPRFNKIPMILETPYNENLDEIELLYSLCDTVGATKHSPRKTGQ